MIQQALVARIVAACVRDGVALQLERNLIMSTLNAGLQRRPSKV